MNLSVGVKDVTDSRRADCYIRPMTAVAWTAIGLLAATLFGSLYYLGAKIDALGARLDSRIDTLEGRLEGRIDSLAARIDARLDALAARLDAHLQRHTG